MLTDLLLIFVNNIAPILMIAGVGYWVGRRYQIDPNSLGRVIFNVFSPALVFYSLVTTEVRFTDLGPLALAMVLFILIMGVLAYAVSGWQTADRVGRAGIVLSVIWPNTGNLGLPVIDFAFGREVLAWAVLVYVVTTIVNYGVGIYVASSGRSSPREALTNILRVPMVYAAIAALALKAFGTALPLPLERSIMLLSQAAIPCMLVLLGLQLAQSSDMQQGRLVGVGTGLRLLISPAIASLLVVGLGLSEPLMIALIMQASMPTAVITIIFANEYQLNNQQVVSTVLASTLISPITLSVLIYVLQHSL